ncbi:MAG: hypothetical protein R3F11_21690 [Verrucomicrobiales bacterium]
MSAFSLRRAEVRERLGDAVAQGGVAARMALAQGGAQVAGERAVGGSLLDDPEFAGFAQRRPGGGGGFGEQAPEAFARADRGEEIALPPDRRASRTRSSRPPDRRAPAA